jgi:hypothetical protein
MATVRHKSNFKHTKPRPETKSLTTRQLYILADNFNRTIAAGQNIVVNGETLVGQLFINETIDILKRIKTHLAELNLHHLVYVILVAYYWQPETGKKDNLFTFITPLIKDIIKNRCLDKIPLCQFSATDNKAIQVIFEDLGYLDANSNVKILTEPQLRRLNSRVSEYFHHVINIPLYHNAAFVFGDTFLTTIVNLLKANSDYICLNRFQAMHEAESIQQALRSDQVVGYLFTNDERDCNEHTEALIITKDRIIKPLHWPRLDEDRAFKTYQFKHLAGSDWITGLFDVSMMGHISIDFLNKLILENSPQRAVIGCGTLSVIYLKQLLKNNAKHLHDYSLCMNIYSDLLGYGDPFGRHAIFIPPPRVLRYSQSAAYNRVIFRLISDERLGFSVGLTNGDASLKHIEITLSKLLKDSFVSAVMAGDDATAAENKVWIEKLPAFRKKWLEQYEREEIKRSAFTTEGNINLYLTYKSHKAVERANKGIPFSSPYLKLMSLPKEYKFIQEEAAILVSDRDFQSLPYRYQYKILLGFLLKQIEQIETKGRAGCFSFFKQKTPTIDVALIQHAVIFPLERLRLVRTSKQAAIDEFHEYECNKSKLQYK